MEALPLRAEPTVPLGFHAPCSTVADGTGAMAVPQPRQSPMSHNPAETNQLPFGGWHGKRGPGAGRAVELEPSRVLRRPSRADSPVQQQWLLPGEQPEEGLQSMTASQSVPLPRQREEWSENSGSVLMRHCHSQWTVELPNQRSVHSGEAGAKQQQGYGTASSGCRVWSRESIAADPKGYLLQKLKPFLATSAGAAHEQVDLLVSQTIQTVEAAAAASLERERLRATEMHRAVTGELQSVQEELQQTERHRSELATLLDTTTATAQKVERPHRPSKARAYAAAAKIQTAWRAYCTRRLRKSSLNGKPVDPYDVIVCFDSLASTIDPANMRIEILRWAHSAFNIGAADQEGLRIVAHMGLFDKGKTFLINQFYGKNLPSGKLHETTGLSMIYVPEHRFLVIDTKGLQAPVSYKSKGIKQLVDASQTEIFIFELVSRIAHYIIFVVNDFTWPEQRNIVQLHQKYVQSKRENQLIVVHNLRTTRSVREAVTLFSKQVSSKYEGVTRSELGGLVFTVDEKPRIHHIGFAEVHSPAGKAFNQKNTAHLLQLLNQLEGIGERRRSVAELLEEHFSKLLPEFVFLESGTGQRLDGTALRIAGELDFSGIGDTLEPDEEHDPTTYRSMGAILLQADESLTVEMKTEGVFSEFCELIAQDVTFKPPAPNVYEQRLKDKVVRVVEFEIPGVHREDITFRKGNRGLSVTLARAKDKGLANYGIAPRFQAPRIPTGEFSFDLFFDDGIWELDGGREAVSHENGILRVRLKQDLQGLVFTLDNL